MKVIISKGEVVEIVTEEVESIDTPEVVEEHTELPGVSNYTPAEVEATIDVIEEEAVNPANPNVVHSDTKPTEDPGEGFEWQKCISRNKDAWTRVRVGR